MVFLRPQELLIAGLDLVRHRSGDWESSRLHRGPARQSDFHAAVSPRAPPAVVCNSKNKYCNLRGRSAASCRAKARHSSCFILSRPEIERTPLMAVFARDLVEKLRRNSVGDPARANKDNLKIVPVFVEPLKFRVQFSATRQRSPTAADAEERQSQQQVIRPVSFTSTAHSTGPPGRQARCPRRQIGLAIRRFNRVRKSAASVPGKKAPRRGRSDVRLSRRFSSA